MRGRSVAETVSVRIESGFPAILNDYAGRATGARSFLRAAWYEAAAGEGGRTILATRTDGRPIAAIPLAGLGPKVVGAQSVPGSYWPFRSILIDPEADEAALSAMFAESRVRATLAPMWRVGPVYRDDPATTALRSAAARAGWTVLTRPLGCSYNLALGTLVAEGEWPRKSTLKRLKNYERQLGQAGEVTFRHIVGAQWDDDVLADLARIEAQSWVAQTDRSGAKFLEPSQREYWRRVTRDPVIAEALSATLMMVDAEPVAFSFDLKVGDTQYSIASSYDERHAAARPGKIVTYRQLQWAAEQGVANVDMGAGDSGYKREMGAVAGTEIIDLLIVRNRQLAQVLQFKWGAEAELDRDVFRAANPNAGSARMVRPLLAASATAAALAMMGE